ncbi:hypothetical protein EMIT093MI4_10570 [Pseudomonas sp. IT-93MI4]
MSGSRLQSTEAFSQNELLERKLKAIRSGSSVG